MGLFDGTSLQQPVTCERCGKTHAQCACPRGLDGKVLDPAAQSVRVWRETGGRGGKTVTIVRGLAPRSAKTDDFPALLKQLKAMLGTGGSVGSDKSGPTLELQGDHREKVAAFFVKLGYPAKTAG